MIIHHGTKLHTFSTEKKWRNIVDLQHSPKEFNIQLKFVNWSVVIWMEKNNKYCTRDIFHPIISETKAHHDSLKPRPNDRNMPIQHIATVVGPNMLCVFGHRVAMCCDMLGVVGSNLTIFKLEPITPNMSQHIATRWPNTRNMMRPTMLRSFGRDGRRF